MPVTSFPPADLPDSARRHMASLLAEQSEKLATVVSALAMQLPSATPPFNFPPADLPDSARRYMASMLSAQSQQLAQAITSHFIPATLPPLSATATPTSTPEPTPTPLPPQTATAAATTPKKKKMRCIPMPKRLAIVETMRAGGSTKEAADVGKCSARQARTWTQRERNGESLQNKSPGRVPAWPLPKAVLEMAKVLAPIALSHRQINAAAEKVGIPPATFARLRPRIKERLTPALVDYWFNGDKRGEEALFNYVKCTKKEMKVGMFVTSNAKIVDELVKKAAEGVSIKFIVDLDQAQKHSKLIMRMMEAGIEVCHATNTFHWKVGIFDSEVLVHGSMNWSTHGMCGPNFECTVVLTGPVGRLLVYGWVFEMTAREFCIVLILAFEAEHDKMFSIAHANGTDRRVRGVTVEAEEKTEVEIEPSEAARVGEKRKQGRPKNPNLFQTTYKDLYEKRA